MLRFVIPVLALVACNCDSGTTPPRPGPSRPIEPPPKVVVSPDAGALVAASEAPALYGQLCAKCHGEKLEGYAADNAPSLANPTFLESATDQFLHASIAGGRPGSSMGAYAAALGGPLDDAAIDSIVTWIRSQGPASIALDPVGAGDATRGAKIYAEYCLTCHGDTANRKDAVHLANIRFLQQASNEFIKHAIVKGRPGTKMLAFGEVMKPQSIDDVVTYVRSFETGAQEEQLLPAPTGKEPIVINPKGKDPGFKAREDRFVPVDEVKAALDKKQKMIIIDARPPSDWRRVHITGAVSYPYHDLDRLKDIPLDVTVLAYCACPHHLSGDVVDALKKLGHKKAYVLDEGINDWHRKGYTIVAAPGVQPPPTESHQGHNHP